MGSMSVRGLDDRIRALATRRYLPETHLDRWLRMDEPSRAALLAAAEDLKLRTGQLAGALEMLDEIAVRDGATPAATLARVEVRRAMKAAGSGPARAAAFLDALRAIRFPRLKRTMERLRAELSGLELPPGLSVALPKDLGSDEFEIRIRARTGADLKRLTAALVARYEGLARLAEILGGEDEI
jgi:hypothetical protein